MAAEALCALFMVIVVLSANAAHLFFLLFPELGALASDVLQRPKGKWAQEPWKLVGTPTLAACAGTLIGVWLPYGVPSILISMSAGIAVVYALRSSVAPAISAGVFPIVLGIRSPLYPLCILGTLASLALILEVWKRSKIGRDLMPDAEPDRKATNILEKSVPIGPWLAAVYVFIAAIGGLAQTTGWHFILFPPLVVIAYEMLGHPTTCPWAKAAFTFPVVCSLSALVGVLAVNLAGVNPIGAALVTVAGFLLLRVGRLRMPPAIAVGLIPFVLPHPDWRYAASVLIGTSCLTAYFFAFSAWQKRRTLP